jgi:adenylate cyclase
VIEILMARIIRLLGPIIKYGQYGVDYYDRDDRRRVILWNIVALISMLSCFVHATVYGLVDIETMGPAVIPLVVAGVIFVFCPQLNRTGTTLPIVVTLLLMTATTASQSYQLGLRFGLHHYFFTIAVLSPLFLGIHRPLQFCCIVLVCIVGYFTAINTFAQFGSLDTRSYSNIADSIFYYSGTESVVIVVILFCYALFQLKTAEDALEAESLRSEYLLNNLLPKEIGNRMKETPDTAIADAVDEAALLFADIVDFTPLSSSLPPDQVVDFLNDIFSDFDRLADKHGLEKIKTIGDAYMACAGVIGRTGNPTRAVAEMALDILDSVKDKKDPLGRQVQIRVGLHCGPAIAGVIGLKKMSFDVWGDTVNTAARMESHGEPGKIQVTDTFRTRLKDGFEFSEVGTVEIKGKGRMTTYFLDRRTSSTALP